MADKETVIAALKCFVYGDDRGAGTIEECRAKNCPYAGTDCEIGIMEDALKLLDPTPPQEYILRSDAIRALCDNCPEFCEGVCANTHSIRDIPTADVEPIVYGEWKERVVKEVDAWSRRQYYCSACGNRQTYGKTPRCCFCGAHMKVADE